MGVVFGMVGSILTTYNDESGSNSTTDYNTTSTVLIVDYYNSTSTMIPYKNNNNDTPDPVSSSSSSSYAVFGDMIGLLSAIGYGAYAVQTWILCPHDESFYNMQIVLGYIDLINMIALSPIAMYQIFVQKVRLSITTTGFLIIKGFDVECILSFHCTQFIL
jgi:hypothetical protein